MKLILLPGMDGTGTLYEPFHAALAPDIDLCVVSYPPDQTLGYSELGKLAAAALPCNGPFVLVGESFSGPIAIHLAAHKPAGLCGLILCCSFAEKPIYLAKLLRYMVRFVPFHNLPLRLLNKVLLGKFSTPALTGQLFEAINPVASHVLRHRAREALRADVSVTLATIDVSTLYLQATEDCVIPCRTARNMQVHLPKMTITPIYAPHFLLQANPTAAAMAIRQWLTAEHLV